MAYEKIPEEFPDNKMAKTALLKMTSAAADGVEQDIQLDAVDGSHAP